MEEGSENYTRAQLNMVLSQAGKVGERCPAEVGNSDKKQNRAFPVTLSNLQLGLSQFRDQLEHTIRGGAELAIRAHIFLKVEQETKADEGLFNVWRVCRYTTDKYFV